MPNACCGFILMMTVRTTVHAFTTHVPSLFVRSSKSKCFSWGVRAIHTTPRDNIHVVIHRDYTSTSRSDIGRQVTGDGNEGNVGWGVREVEGGSGGEGGTQQVHQNIQANDTSGDEMG
jgi:hypothetical protein